MKDPNDITQAFTILNGLTPDQLNFILDCDELKKIRKKYPTQIESLLVLSNQNLSNVKVPNYVLTRSFLATLMEAPSYPLIMLWCLVGVAMNVSFAALSAICGAFGIFILGTIIVFSVGTYRKLKKEDEKKYDEIQLIGLKRLCSEMLLKRLTNDKTEFEKLKLECEELQHECEESTDVENSIVIMLTVSATLFTGYYITIQSVFAALGFSAIAAALAGLTGIGVASALSFGVAIFFSYKQYQLDLSTELMEKHQKKLQAEVDFFTQHCEALQEGNKKHEKPPKRREEKEEENSLLQHPATYFQRGRPFRAPHPGGMRLSLSTKTSL